MCEADWTVFVDFSQILSYPLLSLPPRHVDGTFTVRSVSQLTPSRQNDCGVVTFRTRLVRIVSHQRRSPHRSDSSAPSALGRRGAE